MARRIRELLAARLGKIVTCDARGHGTGHPKRAYPEFRVRNHTIRLEVSGMTPRRASG